MVSLFESSSVRVTRRPSAVRNVAVVCVTS